MSSRKTPSEWLKMVSSTQSYTHFIKRFFRLQLSTECQPLPPIPPTTNKQTSPHKLTKRQKQKQKRQETMRQQTNHPYKKAKTNHTITCTMYSIMINMACTIIACHGKTEFIIPKFDKASQHKIIKNKK